MAHQVIFSQITSVCRNIMHNHTKWFYLLFGIVLSLLTQFSLSTRALASRSGDSILIAQNAQQLEKTPRIEQDDKAIATTYATNTSTRPATTPSIATTSVATPLSDYISIAGTNIPIFASSDPGIDAGNQVGHYGTLYYGHVDRVFGFLASLPAGTTFTITEGGQTTTYTIVHTDNVTYTQANNLRYSLYNHPKYQYTKSASIAIMTCNLALTDAVGNPGRTIVYAVAI